MTDKYVGWLVPAGSITPDMIHFQTRLRQLYHAHGNVSFPDPQFLDGDNSKILECVQNLLEHDPAFDLFAVGGSTGVSKLAQAQTFTVNKIPIVQVVGGAPVANNTFITGYHIDAATVASEQVQRLHQKYPKNKELTILVDPSSDTAPAAFNAAQSEAKSLGIHVTPLQASDPAALQSLTNQHPNPVVGSFMLTPSGMFFNSSNIGYIILLVEDADVPAIYPEREFKMAHTPGYQHKVWVHGHKIRETYLRAAQLACDVLLGNLHPGGEAPDKDDDT